MANQELRIQLKVDGNTKDIRIAQGQMENLSKSITVADKNAKRFSDSVVGVAKAFSGLYVAKQAIDAMTASFKSLANVSMQFEKFETVLKTIEGSSLKAKESMNWVEDFASKTPYQLQQVTDGFVKLKAYGINPINGTLKTLGNTASAMGKDLNQAVEAMADAVTGENERLKEFGIKASKQGQEIAYNWTDASGKAKHIIVKNNSEIIQSTLESIFNSKYAGAMEAQSKTLAGMLSNMQDNFTKFQKNIMDGGLYDYLKAMTQVVNDRFQQAFINTANGAKGFADGAISAINSVIGGAGKMYDAFETIVDIFKVIWHSAEVSFYGIRAVASKVAHEIQQFFIDMFNGIMRPINFIIDKMNSIGANIVGKIDKFNILPDETYDLENSLKATIELEEATKNLSSAYDDLFTTSSVGREYAKKFTDDVKISFEEIKDTIDDGKNNPKTSVAGAIDGTFKGFESKAKESAKVVETTFDQVAKNMYQSFDDYFFSLMKDGFGDLKDLGKSIFNGITDPLARNISGSLAQILTPVTNNVTTVDTSLLSSQGFTQASNGTWSREVDGGTIAINSSGLVTQGASLLSGNSSLSSALNLATLPNTFSQLSAFMANPTAGITNMLYAPSSYMAHIAGSAYGINPYLGEFFGGSANVLGGGTSLSGSIASSAGGFVTAGMEGYFIGLLGDMLFGADTKAPTYGAIGAAIGSVVPVIGTILGGIIGSVIGGFFGSTKLTNTGYSALDTVSFDTLSGDNFKRFNEYTTKSWFDKDIDYSYFNMTASEMEQIKAVFSSLDFVASQIGDFKVELYAGKYTAKGLDETLGADFILNYIKVPQEIINDAVSYAIKETSSYGTQEYQDALNDYTFENFAQPMVQIWLDYAKAVDKTVTEVIIEEVSKMVDSIRTFDVWALNYQDETGIESAKYIQEYLATDYNALLSSYGIDNFLSVEDFQDQRDKALKENFTATEIAKWDALSNSYMAYIDAMRHTSDLMTAEADKLAQELDAQRVADADNLLALLNGYTTTLNNITLAKNRYNGFETTFAMVDEAIANGTDANLIIGMVDEAYNNSIAKQQELYTAQLDSLNSLVEVAQNFKSYAIDLKALADDLSMSVMQNSDKGDFISSRLYGAIGSYKTAVTNKEDASAYYSDITKYTPLYQDYLKSTMTNRYDYEFQIQKLSNELYGLADISDATLGDVEDSIDDLKSSNEKVVNDLKDRALQSLNYLSLDITNDIKSVRDTLNANVPNYDHWWGADSEIVKAIKEALDINMQAVTQAQERAIVDTSSVHYDTNSQADLQAWFDTAKSNYETFSVTGAVDGWTLSELGQLVTFAREVADTGTRAGSLSFEVWEDWYTSVVDWANQISGTHKFADGGIINAPTTFGIAGEAGYPEMITPLKNPNDPLGATSLLNAIEKLDNRLANLEQMAIKRTADTRNIKKQGDRYEIERAATA
jgi:hypothetical protein